MPFCYMSGPPNRSNKQAQPPGSRPGSGMPSLGSFSPGGVQHGMSVSPTGAMSPSPQRRESSSTKSPLLGTAPPPLLPPPDSKGMATALAMVICRS